MRDKLNVRFKKIPDKKMRDKKCEIEKCEIKNARQKMRDNKCEIKKMRNRKCEIIGGCSTLASVIPVEDYNHRRHVRTFREQFVEQIRRLKRAIHYLIHTATRSRHDWNNAGQSAAATNYLTFLYILIFLSAIFLSHIFYLTFFISHFLSRFFFL